MHNDNILTNEIIPSPGTDTNNWDSLEKKFELLKSITKTVHIDLVDDKFAHNTTFLDPAPFKKYADYFFLELHLMVEDPARYIKAWSEVGFKRFIGHIERMPDPIKFIADTELVGEVGLAIDSQTPLTDFDKLDFDLLDLDCMLVMTVKAGFSGQKFIPEMLEKVKKLRAQSDALAIEVDGGLNEATILLALESGANRFVTSSYLFDSPDIKKQYNKLETIVITPNG